MPAFHLVPLQLNCAGFLMLWLGFLFSSQPLLVTLSKQIKGHMIRRGRTLGSIQQPSPIEYNTWATRNTEKKAERKENRKSFGTRVCLGGPFKRVWESPFIERRYKTLICYANMENCTEYSVIYHYDGFNLTVEMNSTCTCPLFECASICVFKCVCFPVAFSSQVNSKCMLVKPVAPTPPLSHHTIR